MTNPVRPAPIDPQRSALLLMDFQVEIVGRLVPDAGELLARVVRVRDLCRRSGVAVCYVRVAFTEQARRAVPERNKSFSVLARTDRLTEGTPQADIVTELQPGPDEAVVTKTRVGAFSTTELADELARRGIDTLLLAGIATSGVVLSTLRDAADRDYRLFVLADCCADADPLVHQVLTERVFPRQAEVIDAAALEGLLPAADRG